MLGTSLINMERNGSLNKTFPSLYIVGGYSILVTTKYGLACTTGVTKAVVCAMLP